MSVSICVRVSSTFGAVKVKLLEFLTLRLVSGKIIESSSVI